MLLEALQELFVAQVFYHIIKISWVCIVDTPMLGWAYYSRQLACVPARLIQQISPVSWQACFQWFDVAFDVAVVFGVCQWTAMALEIDVQLWR